MEPINDKDPLNLQCALWKLEPVLDLHCPLENVSVFGSVDPAQVRSHHPENSQGYCCHRFLRVWLDTARNNIVPVPRMNWSMVGAQEQTARDHLEC